MKEKIFNFETEVTVVINEKNVIAKDESGEDKIDSKNLDSLSYESFVQPRLTPFGLMVRSLIVGYIMLLFCGDEWGAMVFKASAKDILFLWGSLFLFLITTISFFTWVIDLLGEFHLYERLMANFFANKGYAVSITNSGGNNILFYTTLNELSKIKQVVKAIDDLKQHLSQVADAKPQQTRVIQNESTDLDELKKLGDLLAAKIITQEEFDQKKKELLGL